MRGARLAQKFSGRALEKGPSCTSLKFEAMISVDGEAKRVDSNVELSRSQIRLWGVVFDEMRLMSGVAQERCRDLTGFLHLRS